jgi:LPS O-antigen subunit length determinant protein (WzzB/FepE family)
MDARPDVMDDDEISLMDIYDFIRDGWWALVGMTALGLVVGLVTAFVLPTQYQASALIDSGKVGFYSRTDGVSLRGLDSAASLAEKMKLPGFYSDKTVVSCGMELEPATRAELARALSPNVPRNSSFVSVSYRTSTSELAQACLEAVLDDVIDDQALALSVAVTAVRAEIQDVAEQVSRLRTERDQVREARLDGLQSATEQLRTTRTSLQKLDQRLFEEATNSDSAVVMLLLTLRTDLQELETLVSGLRVSFSSDSLLLGANLPELSERLAGLQLALQAPNTQSARFVSGINAPLDSVAPRRSLIVVIGVLIGGFAGLMLLIGRRAIVHIRAHEAQRRARAAS